MATLAQAFKSNAEVKRMKREISKEEHHDHRGRFTEGFLDKQLILDALNVEPGQTILDAGCGDGYMSKAFSKKVNHSGKVYAVDSDKHCIEILRKEAEGTNVQAIEGDITNLMQVDQSSVDIIHVSTVIHGFSQAQLRAFLEEAKRLLKTNGVLAIVEIEKKETPFGPPLNMRFFPEELREAVAMAPLNNVKVGEHLYMQMFRNTKS